MEKLKVGVIGVGHLGRHHARVYSQLPEVELIGVHDLLPQKARSVAEEFKTSMICSESEILEKVQALSIATTTKAHFRVARAALEKGVHVLIEKPLASSVKEAEELIRLAENKALTLQVGHIERFNPAVLSLKEKIDKISPRFIEAHRLAAFTERGTDVAVILDLMTHDLDLILSWVDSEVAEIQAAGVSVVTDSDDIANARLTFANGCVANLTASRVSAKPLRKIRLFQKDLYASLDLAEKSWELYRLLTKEELGRANLNREGMKFQIPVEKVGKTIVYEKPSVKNEDMLTLELSSFIEAVNKKKAPPVDGRQGLKVVRLASQIQEKIDRHRRQVRM